MKTKQVRSKMKIVALLSLSMLVLLSACGNNANEESESGQASVSDSAGKIKVVSTFTIISDIVRQIGKENVDVYNLVPTGTDPHEYEPLPEDTKAATDADILFYNGLNLEGGDQGWFAKLIKSVGQDESHVFKLTEGVEPMYLHHENEEGRVEEINPHAFINPVVGIQMAEDARDALTKVDPDHADDYKKNADEYLKTLHDLDDEYRTKISAIPEEERILVTSERAFQYMAAEYGLKEGYIWAIDTDETGSSEQMKDLITFLKENKAPVLFLETNVDRRPMDTVSKESGVPIYDGGIYSDEIGEVGSEVDTYEKYLNFNIKQISEGLTSQENK
jgi:ABC-type Zn uptake system ZnuABC Zn-binding protein ZnuA